MTKTCEYCKNNFHTKDKRQKYCNKTCYFKTKTGENNYFYHYNPTEEVKKKTAKINSENFKGSGNPFHGKTHSQESLEKIKQGNERFREQNKELIEQRHLKRLNLDEEKIKEIFNEYKNTHETFSTLQEKYGIDKRVLKKYMVKYCCSKEDLKKISHDKQYKNATSVGEETLFLLLCNTFGKEKVKRQHKLLTYYYDFLIDEKLLIEYDGFYWHALCSNNDDEKNKLALQKNIRLYRVKENEKRKVDFLSEIEKIKEVFNEI